MFFIFIVANAGGLLTPLGDPPLFLGFLRGVPFAWTLRLAPAWALVNGVLLALFVAFDKLAFAREGGKPPTSRRPDPALPALEIGPLRLEGAVNLLWLLGIVGVVFATGMLGARLARFPQLQTLAQVAGMALFAGLSWMTTPRAVRAVNRFSWAPMIEVAAIFLGVFITMIPALSYLEQRGASLGVTQPWQFFWASGALSSVLDNAPTYLTFASLAVGVTDAGSGMLVGGRPGRARRAPDGGAPAGGRVLRRRDDGRRHLYRQRPQLHGQGDRGPASRPHAELLRLRDLVGRDPPAPVRARLAPVLLRWLPMHYPRPGEPIVPRLLRPLVLERYPGSFATDPDSTLLARDELGGDAWQRLPAETCRRVSLLVVDRVQTRLRALPEPIRDTLLPSPDAALALPLELRTMNTLRRARASRADDGPWTVGRYLALRRFGARALIDLLAAFEARVGVSLPTLTNAGLASDRALQRVLLSISRRLPIAERQLDVDGLRDGRGSGPLDVTHLLKSAAQLGHDLSFRVIDLGGTRVVVRLRDLTAARAAYRIAVRTVRTVGAATLEGIAGQTRATSRSAIDGAFVDGSAERPDDVPLAGSRVGLVLVRATVEPVAGQRPQGAVRGHAVVAAAARGGVVPHPRRPAPVADGRPGAVRRRPRGEGQGRHGDRRKAARPPRVPQ